MRERTRRRGDQLRTPRVELGMRTRSLLLSLHLLALACDEPVESLPLADAPRCGPASARVLRVIDGDTVEINVPDANGKNERVRLLLVDTPETTKGKNECGGVEATAVTTEMTLDRDVKLAYDRECRDHYGRLLAYVEAPDGVVNEMLLARGKACVLQIKPNGAAHIEQYRALEKFAESGKIGSWLTCPEFCE